MPIELSIAWTVFLNVIGWPIIQFGWALAITSIPAAKFGNPTFFSWEVKGHIYRHHLAIAKWKHWLPDAASLFGIGVSKQELGSNCRNELQSFVRDVRRGEICHWCAMMSAPIFFLWNPAWADLVMLAFGAAINLPCIASLRYARLRLTRILCRSHRT